jgi:hypothetical protein
VNSYRTVLKVAEPGRVIVDVPFPAGETVEVVVQPCRTDRQQLVREFREAMKRTQALPHIQALTEEGIAAEIAAYRNGL